VSEHTHVTAADGVIEVVLDRPEKKNALTGAMYAELSAAIERADAEPSVRAVLVSSVGDTFCAGNDLQDFVSSPPTADSPVVRFLRTLAGTSVPLVVAVQGAAVGVGATMLLHADHVVVAETASLRYPFASMALVPEAGSSMLLPRVTGYLRAADLLLTGEPVSATRAVELGLASRVVAPGEELEGARAFVARLRRQPPAALRLTKKLLRADETTLLSRMEQEMGLFVQQLQSPEFGEAVAAFMQKREPDFDAL
jgi:enoyl-CoA hydratase/carnithine racemase